MSTGARKQDAEFDDYAQNYDSALSKGISLSGEDRDFFAQRRIELLTKNLVALDFRATKVMDFGCGDGNSTPYLLKLPGAEHIHGVDVSSDSIKRAQANYASRTISFDVINDTPPESRFDLVFSNGVFHHIPLSERPSAISYIFSALRPGGLFVLWENNPWNPGTKLIMSRIPFDKDAITLTYLEAKRRIRAGGFNVLSAEFAFYFPRCLSVFRGLEPALKRIPLGAQYSVLGRKPS